MSTKHILERNRENGENGNRADLFAVMRVR